MKRLLLSFLIVFTSVFAGVSNFDDISLNNNTGKYSWTNDPDTYLQRSAANTLILVVGGTTQGTITSAGFAGNLNSSIIGGTTPAAGTFTNAIVDLFLEIDPAAAVDTSATDNSTITPVSTYQIVDTWQDVAQSTINIVATLNIKNGTLLYLQTANDGRDLMVEETGNIDLSDSTRTLNKTLDLLILLKTGTNQWVEAGYFDNN